MSYSFNLITDKTQLLALQVSTASDIKTLQYLMEGILLKQQSFLATGLEISVDVATAFSEVTALTTVLASLPEGATKDDNIAKLKKAEYSYFLLTQKDKKHGTLALVDKELELEKSTQELAVVTAFAAAIDARLAELA